MSRGFDGFEIDDFRDSQWESEPSDRSRESSRGRGTSSQTEASVRTKLAKLREVEYQSDHLDLQSRARPESEPRSLPRGNRQADLLAHERTESTQVQKLFAPPVGNLHPHRSRQVSRGGCRGYSKARYVGDCSRLDSDSQSDSSTACRTRHERTQTESRQVLTLTRKQTPGSSPRLRTR